MQYTIQQLAKITMGKAIVNAPTENLISHLLIDTRKIIFPANSLFVALNGKRQNGHQYLLQAFQSGVKNFLVQEITIDIKDENANFIVVNNTLNALQQISAYHRSNFNYPVVGITGSNGKTVSKEWLGFLYTEKLNIVKNPKSYNSQIGVPLSVWQMEANHQIGFFEAGISEKGEMQNLQQIINPDIGIFTYAGNAHNEGFASINEKLNEKMLLFKNSKLLIYCIDQTEVEEAVTELKKLNPNIKTIAWSKKNHLHAHLNFSVEPNLNFTKIKYKETEITIPFTDDASVWNACICFAFSLCTQEITGISFNEIKPRFTELPAVEMRMQLIEGINNCMIINDSYSADLDSMRIALDFLQQQSTGYKKTVIVSDFLESGIPDNELYKKLANLINQSKINKVICIGKKICLYKHFFDENAVFYYTINEFTDSFNQINFSHEIILLKGARAFTFEKIKRLLEKKIHHTVFEINLNALVHNLNVYKSLLEPKVKLMAMVKAFSYGAGSFEIAKVLEFNKVDYLTVAYADEGVVLRKAGIKTPIMVMNPETSGFDAMFKYNLEPEVYNFRILNELALAANGIDIGVHIEIDTGMKRLGFNANDIDAMFKILNQHTNISVKSVFTHLAASDESEHDDFTKQQISSFESISNKICKALNYPILRHCLNSSGIVRFKHTHFDMVRLGVGLYGIDPSFELQDKLDEIGTLKTVISQIRIIQPNESVGYGRKGKVNKQSTIAITAIGYADGLNRLLSNGNGYMLVNGKKAPIVGNICMDMTMIDVTDIDCKEGDEVIVFGNGINIVEIAKKLNTIPYEILTSISQRVKRVYYFE
ncbi:MAG: bifunctional UDP-N-acetylmuramoyl-tripeptide:D-alanyl-D-alanine ligase/alanine racemase [Bacteroidia bacterium]